MADLEPVGVEAVVEGVDDFTSQMGEMQGAVDKTGESAEETSGPMSNLGSVIGTVAGVAAGVAVAAFAALAGAVASCIGPAAEAEAVEVRLDSALRAMGDSAVISKEAALDLATSMSQLTAFDDEAVLSAETVMMRFSSIGEDIFPQAMQSAADMAAMLGMDLSQASRMLGMALESPADGMSRLRRMGVTFTDEQQATIKAMQEGGDAAGAQAMMLDILNSKFGGTAAAMADTYQGRMQQLKNSFDNIKETIGAAVLPALTSLSEKFMTVLADPTVQAAIASIANWLSVNLPIAIDFLITKGTELWSWLSTNLFPVIEQVIGFFGGMGEAVTGSGGVLEWLATTFANVSAAVTTLWGILEPAFDAIGQVISQVWTGTIQPALAEFVDAISYWWNYIQPQISATWDVIWDKIVFVATAISKFVQDNMGNIRAIFAGIWQAIMAIVETAWGVISGLFDFFLNLLEGDMEGAATALRGIWDTLWNGIVDFLTGIGVALLGVWNTLWSQLGPAISTAWTEIKTWFEGVWDGIKTYLSTIWVVLTSTFRTMWENVKTAITTAFNEVKEWFETAWGTVTGFIEGIDLLQAGKDIIAGLWQGLKDMWSDVVDWWQTEVLPAFSVNPGSGRWNIPANGPNGMNAIGGGDLGKGIGDMSKEAGGRYGFGPGEDMGKAGVGTGKAGGGGNYGIGPGGNRNVIGPMPGNPMLELWRALAAGSQGGAQPAMPTVPIGGWFDPVNKDKVAIGPIYINNDIDEALFIERVRMAVATAIP